MFWFCFWKSTTNIHINTRTYTRIKCISYANFIIWYLNITRIKTECKITFTQWVNMINLLSLSKIGLFLVFSTLNISIDAMNAQSHFNLQFIRHTRTKENFRFLVGILLKWQIPKMWRPYYTHTRILVFVVCSDKLLFNRRIFMLSFLIQFTIHPMIGFTVWLYFTILHCWFSDIMPFIFKYFTSHLTLTWGFTFCFCIHAKSLCFVCALIIYLNECCCHLKSNLNLNTLKMRCVMISMVKFNEYSINVLYINSKFIHTQMTSRSKTKSFITTWSMVNPIYTTG